MNNSFLALDNVNYLMNQLTQKLPGLKLDLQSLVNFMQQLSQRYPNNGIDHEQYKNNLNNYTVSALLKHYGQAMPEQLKPERTNPNRDQESQELSRLVDQLKRERNYSSQSNNVAPPVRSFADQPDSNENLLDEVKQKVINERALNGTIKSVNLTDVLDTETPFTNKAPFVPTPPLITEPDPIQLTPPRTPEKPTENWTERLLALDYRTDLIDWEKVNRAIFKFPLVSSVKAIELVSLNLKNQRILQRQPYLYFSLETPDWSFNSAVITGKQEQSFFGKLIPQKSNWGDWINYRLEDPAPQFLPQSVNLNQLAITLYDYQCKAINLKAVSVKQITRVDKNKIKLDTPEAQNFELGDYLLMTQTRDKTTTAYKNKIIELTEHSLTTKYQASDLNNLSIYRSQVEGHLTLKLTIV